MTTESIPFAKLEGLGNDFVLIDRRRHPVAVTPDLARELGDRRRGVGCDQILVLEAPRSDGAVCSYRIFNADGSEVEQCGNGARCIGLWLHLAGELDDQGLLDSPAGAITVRRKDESLFEATLSVPDFQPESVGRDLHGPAPWLLEIDGRGLEVYGASLGNPHLLVLQEQSPENLTTVGDSLNRHPGFPRGVNVGIGQIVDPHTLRLQVFERGAGPTPACGSGAGAAAAILIHAGKMRNPATVIQPGGPLVIEWRGNGHPVRMTGPARMVFRGHFEWKTAAE